MNNEDGESMGRDSKDIGHPSGGNAPNLSNGWVSMLSAQARAQMELLLRRARRLGNSRCEILLQPDGRYNIEGGRVYKGAARRRALLSVQKRLHRIRGVLSGASIGRHSKNRRRRKGPATVITELQIITQTMFFEMLNERVTKNNMSYVDAIVDICDTQGVEIESVPKLLNQKTRKLIQNEALALNMLKRKGARLPI